MYYKVNYSRSSYLTHHGIKGQKWGIRRWQNPDGSLTPAGREHYGRYLDPTTSIREAIQFDKAASKDPGVSNEMIGYKAMDEYLASVYRSPKNATQEFIKQVAQDKKISENEAASEYYHQSDDLFNMTNSEYASTLSDEAKRKLNIVAEAYRFKGEVVPLIDEVKDKSYKELKDVYSETVKTVRSEYNKYSKYDENGNNFKDLSNANRLMRMVYNDVDKTQSLMY